MNVTRTEWYRTASLSLGFTSLVRLQFQKRFTPSARLMKLTSKYLDHPVYARHNTTDLSVFDLIFVEREYRCLDPFEVSGLILDCGANIGYSSAYLLSRYPKCHLIAVEPDEGNFALLKKNVAPYEGRCRPIKAAVWPYEEPIQLSRESLIQGNEWGRSIERATTSSDNNVQAIDIPSLLATSGFDRIALLKVDIEGSEKELFQHYADRWLGKVDNILVELHGKDASNIFYTAIERENFSISTAGELTVCLRNL